MRKLLTILVLFLSIICNSQININYSFATTFDCSPNDVSAIGISDKVYTAGRLYLFAVMTTGATNPGTVSGTTLTWTNVISIGDATRRIQLYRCMPGATTAGTEDVLINTFGGGGSVTGYVVGLWEITGVLTTGTNGADAIVQSTSGGATGADPSITMAAITSGRNAVISMFYNDANPFGGTPESGWTEVIDCGSTPPTAGGYLMSRYFTTDNTPTVTAASSTWIGVAVELASAGRRIFNIN